MPRRRPSSHLPAIPPTRSTPPARRHQRPAVQMETDRQTGARREGEEGDKAREKEKRKNGQRHAIKVIYTEPRPICHQDEPPALPLSSRVRLSPSRCRLPCCRRCNSAFGEFAEPGRIFARLQTGEPRPPQPCPPVTGGASTFSDFRPILQIDSVPFIPHASHIFTSAVISVFSP